MDTPLQSAQASEQKLSQISQLLSHEITKCTFRFQVHPVSLFISLIRFLSLIIFFFCSCRVCWQEPRHGDADTTRASHRFAHDNAFVLSQVDTPRLTDLSYTCCTL